VSLEGNWICIDVVGRHFEQLPRKSRVLLEWLELKMGANERYS
jgi:hypothetical protein